VRRARFLALAAALAAVAALAFASRPSLAVAAPPAPAPARDRGEWMVAARAGAFLPEPFSPLGASFLAGVEAGWALPPWKHRFVIVADAGVTAPEAAGHAASPSVGGAYAWHVQLREIAFGLSLYYRHPIGRFTPYLGVGPRLLVVDSAVEGAAGAQPFAPTRQTSAHVGAGVVPGFAIAAGPGQAFVELPLCFARAVERATGEFNAGSIALAFGYRVWF
jgi:hypothetical protein